jgi:transglutaminase-like putative cysteine protease
MLYDVRHKTTFVYEQSVSVSHHVLHLMPRGGNRQQRLNFTLNVDPEPSQESENQDYFGNNVHHLTMQVPHERLVVESNSRVDVQPRLAAIDLENSASWDDVAARLKNADADAFEPQPFLFDSPYIAMSNDVRKYAQPSFASGRPILAAAMDLTSRIFNEFEYQGGVSDISTPVRQVLKMRKGVCQDFAHLQIACLRSLGLAARYVSGYLLTHPPPGKKKLVGSDASHAWLSVWAGDLGWVDFDPTNNVIPDHEHITVGWGRDYGDVSPVNGFITGGGAHELLVSVDVSAVA